MWKIYGTTGVRTYSDLEGFFELRGLSSEIPSLIYRIPLIFHTPLPIRQGKKTILTTFFFDMAPVTRMLWFSIKILFDPFSYTKATLSVFVIGYYHDHVTFFSHSRSKNSFISSNALILVVKVRILSHKKNVGTSTMFSFKFRQTSNFCLKLLILIHSMPSFKYSQVGTLK